VQITTAEAREPMGKAKRAHIETCSPCGAPHNSGATARQLSTSADVDTLYAEFLPMQAKCLRRTQR